MRRVCLLVVMVLLLSGVKLQAQGCPGGALHCATLNWTEASSPAATSFNIYRTLTSGQCSNVNAAGCTKVGSTTAPTETFVDSPLAASTTYFWVVTAVNASGESAPSAQASTTTGQDPVPSPPTGLTVTSQ